MKYFLDYLPVRSMRYTVRAPCTSLPKRNRWPSRLRIRYSDSSETGGQSVKVWGFGSHEIS